MSIKKLKKLFLVFLVVIICIGIATGCIPGGDNNRNNSSKISLPTVDGGKDNNQNSGFEVIPLTVEELKYFNGDEFFNGEHLNIRNQFISSFYDVPEKINLFELFYCGSGIEEIPTEEERNAVVVHNNWDMEPDCACIKVSRDNMDTVLMENMGLTLADTEKIELEYYTYLEQYDAYYLYHGDTNYRMDISFFDGEREGNIVRLFYDDEFMNEGEIVLTLREQDGTYLFVSNQRVSG